MILDPVHIAFSEGPKFIKKLLKQSYLLSKY